jgi:glycosyltransferase involved in cell wall biosynthesis
VDPEDFPFTEDPEDYLLFMGRFVSGKGPLHAIRVAEALDMRLVLAGPKNAYFRERVAPMVDGQRVQYAGFVEGPARARLLGRARALLYPIQYPESFGLVLVESMLCGTPVAAVSLGAVPEIVEDGVTGATAADPTELTKATTLAMSLNRHLVRSVSAERFSVNRMVRDYLEVYRRLPSDVTPQHGPSAP